MKLLFLFVRVSFFPRVPGKGESSQYQREYRAPRDSWQGVHLGCFYFDSFGTLSGFFYIIRTSPTAAVSCPGDSHRNQGSGSTREHTAGLDDCPISSQGGCYNPGPVAVTSPLRPPSDLARISHQLTVEARDRPAITSLRLLAVLNVLLKYASARRAAHALY